MGSRKLLKYENVLLTPPPNSSRRTKWGSEVWKAKKNSPTNSLSTMISSTSSSSSSSTTDKTTNISIDSLVGELNIDVYSELANQEKLLRDAMKRKQQQKQKHDPAIKKVKPTTVDHIDGSSSSSSDAV